MKKITFLLSLMIITTVAFSNGTKNGHQVHILSVRMNIVHIKLTHEFQGATLEIYNENGEVVLSQVLNERKVLIDFDRQQEGVYRIEITKGTEQVMFDYINSHSSFIESAPSESIMIVEGI